MSDLTPREAVEVRQCDREAAAELLGGAAPEGLLDGRVDTLSLVQILARHRQAAEAAAYERAAVRAEGGWNSHYVIQSSVTGEWAPGSPYDRGAVDACRNIATAIRLLATQGAGERG
jgi:hypothetical protein